MQRTGIPERCDCRMIFQKADAGKLSASENEMPVPLRVAIAAVISPKESFVYYRELFDFMSERLNMKLSSSNGCLTRR
jgi:hypothetical protein